MTITLRKLLRRRMQPLVLELQERLIDLAIAEIRRAQGLAIAQLTSALTAAPRHKEPDAAPEDQDKPGRAARRARRGGGVPRARARRADEGQAVAGEVDRADRGPDDDAPAPGPGSDEPSAARRQRCKVCGELGHNARRHRNDSTPPPATEERAHTPTASSERPAPPAAAPELDVEPEEPEEPEEEEYLYDRRDPAPPAPTGLARGADRFATLESAAAARRAKEGR